MEFHYYYLIQDIVGVFLIFVNVRIALTCTQLIFKNGVSLSAIMVLTHYVLLIAAGFCLVLNVFGLIAWAMSMLLISLSVGLTGILRVLRQRKSIASI